MAFQASDQVLLACLSCCISCFASGADGQMFFGIVLVPILCAPLGLSNTACNSFSYPLATLGIIFIGMISGWVGLSETDLSKARKSLASNVGLDPCRLFSSKYS